MRRAHLQRNASREGETAQDVTPKARGFLSLQRLAGNRAVHSLLRRQRSPTPGRKLRPNRALPHSAVTVGSSPPPIQKKFAEDTTYGLEIEFRNRWISAFDFGKDLEPADLEEPLAGWKAGSDRGRSPSDVSGTVLEYESAVFGGAQWKSGAVDSAVSKAFEVSLESAARVASANDLKSPAAEVKEFRDDTEVSVEDKESMLPDLKENLKQIEADHKVDPQATLQVTTLGKRSDEHQTTLGDVVTDVDALNSALAPESDAAAKLIAAKAAAREVIAELQTEAKLESPADKLVMEDLAAVTSVMVQSIVLAEYEMTNYGTIKNLVDPLPRRIIGPPPEGFRKRLGIGATVYEKHLDNFSRRVSALGEKIPASGLTDQLYTLSWFASGEVGEADTLATTKAEKGTDSVEWELAAVLSSIEMKGSKSSLWHDIAESEPTLESTIIKKAKKPKPEEWTAHEIRNFFFSQGIAEPEMRKFLAVLKKHMK